MLNCEMLFCTGTSSFTLMYYFTKKGQLHLLRQHHTGIVGVLVCGGSLEGGVVEVGVIVTLSDHHSMACYTGSL